MASAPPRPDVPELARLPLEVLTPRLRLRPIATGDVDELWPFVSDPQVSRLLSWSAHKDRSETDAFIASQIEARAKGTDLTWVIEHEGRARGCIGLHGISWEFRAWRIDRAELGYWLAPPLWGRGLMTEAATAATRWAFETLGLHKLTVGHIEGNQASKRIIEKIGFRFLARLEDDVWRDGRWWAHFRYEMTAAEWLQMAGTSRP
jgi:ribosomal-protein-alanine N-acetyltransferase